MAKIITADNFPGQKMMLWHYFYHSSTSQMVIYPTGVTTNTTYPYGKMPMPFDGKATKAMIINSPYSSYTSGPTGSSATFYVYKNGSQLDSDTQTYTVDPIIGAPYEKLTFTLDASFSAGDYLEFRFQSNGLWRYCNSIFEFEIT